MPEAKRYPTETRSGDFEMFKNGKVNLQMPCNYNWALGRRNPPMGKSFKRITNTLTVSTARINGQHLIL